jgi:hypothetical protein
MSKKRFVVILVLSVVVTYGVAVVDDLRRNSLLAGEGGVPFRFSSGTLFGSGNTNYLMLTLDIFFWFVVIWIVWFGIRKLTNK